jgi:GDPmannose 4,6-dehydratase
MKNVALISGISGQDGSLLAERLLTEGYEVHGFVRRTSIENSEQHLPNLRGLSGKVNLHTAPIDNQSAVYKAVSAVQPTELYHLAASSFVNYGFDDESSVLSFNFNSTNCLLSAVKELRPDCRFFLAGSSEMFGKVDRSPQNEDTPFNPRSIYGISKVASYHLLKNFRSQFGIFACTAFLYNHESPRRAMQFVTRKIAHSAARIKLGLQKRIVLGNLEAQRDWGYAPDYVKAIATMMRSNSPEDYVISTGKLHTVRQFAEAAFAHAGLKLNDHLEFDQSVYRSSDKIPLCGDSTKIRRALGWENTKTFEDVIAEMVDAEIRDLSKSGGK